VTRIPITAAFILTTLILGAWAGPKLQPQARIPALWHTEPQLAAGEWKEEIQIPPCVVTNGRPNVEVNFTRDGDRIVKATIECNKMPVGTR